MAQDAGYATSLLELPQAASWTADLTTIDHPAFLPADSPQQASGGRRVEMVADDGECVVTDTVELVLLHFDFFCFFLADFFAACFFGGGGGGGVMMIGVAIYLSSGFRLGATM